MESAPVHDLFLSFQDQRQVVQHSLASHTGEDGESREKNNSPVAALEISEHVIFSVEFQMTMLRNVAAGRPGQSGTPVK